MRRSGGLIALAVAACALAAPARPAAVQDVQDVQAMKSLVNATRAQHGLRPLRFAGILDRSSLLKAEAILRCGSFSHTPCGAPFARTFQQVGYRNHSVGENLAWGTGGSAVPQAILSAWLASPRHRALLLSALWREAGVAAVEAPSLAGHDHVRLWVLQFGGR
jgi:uncharacterized protein YkwD